MKAVLLLFPVDEKGSSSQEAVCDRTADRPDNKEVVVIKQRRETRCIQRVDASFLAADHFSCLSATICHNNMPTVGLDQA